MNISIVLMIIKKAVSSLKKEYFLSKLKNKCPDDDEIDRTQKIIQTFDIKNGDDLTQLYLKSDVILLADGVENFVKVSTEECGINPL